MQDYVARFHRARPGITEAVLRRSRDGGITPYEWLLAAVPDDGVVLDVACGSAPMWPALAGRPYLGADTSAEELALAQRAGAFPLVRASAAQLPVATNAVTAVVASMALMVVRPLPDALAEVHRVLAPGGRLVATVPARGPLRGRDMPVVGGLLVALGRVPAYPNDRLTPRLPALLRAAGFRVVSDASRRFSYPMRSAGDADTLLDSLYLPGLTPTRHRCARAYLHALAGGRLELPVPIRRIIASRHAGHGCDPRQHLVRVELQEATLVGSDLVHVHLGEPGGGEPRDRLEVPLRVRPGDHRATVFSSARAVSAAKSFGRAISVQALPLRATLGHHCSTVLRASSSVSAQHT